MSERDVERACAAIASSLQNNTFKVSDSLVRSIERKSTLPSAAKLYSLCRVYQISLLEAFSWYGLPFGELVEERLSKPPERTILVNFDPSESAGIGPVTTPQNSGSDANATALLTELAEQWGESLAPLMRSRADKSLFFGKVGKNDLFLFPLILPGSLLVIDPAQTELAAHQSGGYWRRPIYFLELMNEYVFGYCELLGNGRLLLRPHADSPSTARELTASEDLKVIGRVISVAIPDINRHFEIV